MSDLFDNTSEALTFAYHYSSQQYAQTPMAKLLKGGNIGRGKGLGGLAGAAQAGLIRAAVERLPELERHCLSARFSAKTEPCDCGSACCVGEKFKAEYLAAMGALRAYVFQTVPAQMDAQAREAILRAYFGESINLPDEFERRQITRATGYRVKGQIWDTLKELETRAQNMVSEQLAQLMSETTQ